ncbi:MAG: cyclic nucleotide-binding domain-containing protein [Flavobacterium sp.]|nr:cyclic nucleotide-binding domain-containing protein [Flavobacterium sp.]
MDKITFFLQKFISLDEDELNAFSELLKKEKIDKGSQIIKAGKNTNKIYFVNEGFLKYTMIQGENEKAIHIASEFDLVTDFLSFYSSQPAISSVYAITDCELLSITREQLEILYQNYKVWEKFVRLVAQFAVLDLIMEKLKFQTKTPKERYLELIATKPTILQAVNLGIIAECLGITQESLSRIRGRI